VIETWSYAYDVTDIWLLPVVTWFIIIVYTTPCVRVFKKNTWNKLLPQH